MTDPLISAIQQVRNRRKPTPPTGSKSVAAVMALKAPDGEEGDIWQRTYERVFAATGDKLKATLAAMGMVNRLRMGLSYKATVTVDQLTVSGWGILFGDKAFKDLEETYFNKDTAYLLEYYPGAPLWYQHGMDKDYMGSVIGKRAGYEWHEDVGIWFTHELYADHPLIERTINEIEDGALGYSSDSIKHFADMGMDRRDRHLAYWPVAGFSLVKKTRNATQAEPGLGNVVLDNPK